ncbi:MAG: hypothetical protein IGQ45_01415 [Cyanobacterium sp. T60_A2020_053]|nr:hypothetical protein [Cyanobacterium sp. T60_A2020_053]
MLIPKFKTRLDYEKARVIMQPTFIRVVDNIRKIAEDSAWEITYQEINEPFPSYIVTQKKGDTVKETNVWKICFQVCFKNYVYDENQTVEIDDDLVNNQGELNWQKLEEKTKYIITNLFDA